jgi:hypothetical protein
MEQSTMAQADVPYLCEPFVLRMAGFPFSWLAELADDDTPAAATAVLAAEAARSPGRRPTAAERQHLDDLTDRFHSCYQAALARTRLLVGGRFVADEELRGMLFALNPHAYPAIAHWLDRFPADPRLWRSKDRWKLDALTLYLQRACAKNDSTGGAGPFAVGRFDAAADGIQAADAPLDRHSFLARWAADAMLAWLAGTAEGGQVATPRRAPGVALVGTEADHLPFDYRAKGDLTAAIGDRRRHDLNATDRAVLALCDGDRTPAAICRQLAASGYADLAAPTGPAGDGEGDGGGGLGREVERSLARLAAAGLIVRGPELPYGMHDPLPMLARLADAAGSAPLADLVARCVKTVEVVAGADLPQRQAALAALSEAFVETVGRQPDRQKGGFYSDRALTAEDSEGRFRSLTIGRQLTGQVQRALPLVIDTYMLVPRARLRWEGELLADWFATRFPGGAASVNDYLSAFVSDQDRLRPVFETLDRSVVELDRQLRDAATAATAAAASDADPAAAVGRFRQFLAAHAPRTPVVCDVDLMFAAAPGADRLADPSRLVVGEVHSDEETLSHGIFTPFVERRCPDFAAEVLRGYQGLLGDGEIVMDACLRHSDKTFTRRLLACPDIEAFDRSPAPAHQRRQFADLVVESGPTGLRLAERATGRGVRLIAVPFAWLRIDRRNPMTIFGFPKRPVGSLFSLAPGEHLPEIGFGDVVLFRRCWSVDPAELRTKHPEDGFLAVRRLRDRLGLPRHVFAGIPEETKPIYVDLDSPLLVRQLSRFAATASAVRLSEMLPGPDELWVRSRGERFTSELRFSAFAGRPPGAPAAVQP